MPELVQLHYWRWPGGGGTPLATLNMGAAELGTALRFVLVRWIEPGLGHGKGFGVRLPSGDPILISEHEGDGGHSTITVDRQLFIDSGPEDLLRSVLEALDLSSDRVAWLAPLEAVEAIRAQLSEWPQPTRDESAGAGNPLAGFQELILGDWTARLQQDEWVFAKLAAQAKTLAPERAFDLLGQAATLALGQSDPILMAQASALLLGLARRSETTELTVDLKFLVSQVIDRLGPADSTASQLASWYRLRE